jgi:DNA-binding transcriptional ArsR family regulator
MHGSPNFAPLAALMGDPARSAMLAALMGGRALPATDLALEAGVSPQTASAHLAKLLDGDVLRVEKVGRHRYFRLADDDIADLVERLMVIAQRRPGLPRVRHSKAEALRNARTCYDHLAGRLGVAVTRSLVTRRMLVAGDADFRVTRKGEAFFAQLGLDLGPLRASRRVFARRCLDWSERRPHLAGSLGAALASHCFDRGWLMRVRDGRQVFPTDTGRRAFRDMLTIDLPF